MIVARETVRQLAPDYGVSHTTLSRYLARPVVANQLKQAERLNRAEQQAGDARWRAEQKAERAARHPDSQRSAVERLKDAALVIEDHPIALQLRYLQTLLELGSSQATTIVFPAPLDLVRAFLPKS